jgi:hypothetical protein
VSEPTFFPESIPSAIPDYSLNDLLPVTEETHEESCEYYTGCDKVATHRLTFDFPCRHPEWSYCIPHTQQLVNSRIMGNVFFCPLCMNPAVAHSHHYRLLNVEPLKKR